MSRISKQFTAKTVTRVHRRTCKHCHQSFTANRVTARYCTDRCRMAAYRARRKPARRAEPALGTLRCVHCGQAFKGRAGQLYCGGSCKTLAYRARREAAVEAIAAYVGTSLGVAADSMERNGMARASGILKQLGMVYDHASRRWLVPAGQLARVLA